MTMEEELDWLYRLRSNIYVYMPKEWLIPMNTALDMAVETLEQEPILDKIRAEIEKCYCTVTNDYDHGRNYGLYMATQIIDKYKAESEGKR